MMAFIFNELTIEFIDEFSQVLNRIRKWQCLDLRQGALIVKMPMGAAFETHSSKTCGDFGETLELRSNNAQYKDQQDGGYPCQAMSFLKRLSPVEFAEYPAAKPHDQIRREQTTDYATDKIGIHWDQE